MSHGPLRKEKNCLNCGQSVPERYCPKCGQENTEPRQRFHYLFTHFFEDFTHYDGQFWRTMRLLIFAPARLSKIYLSGKRMKFVPPVKMYIFVSFVTFFLASFLTPNINNRQTNQPVQERDIDAALTQIKQEQRLSVEDSLAVEETLEILQAMRDSTARQARRDWLSEEGSLNHMQIFGAHNLQEYDRRLETKASLSQKLFRPFAKKLFELQEQRVPIIDAVKSFFTVFMHTLPKALFFYLPLFALLLWIFHDKKKWWYFDHGIFTLHYFSFLLVMIGIVILLNLFGTHIGTWQWYDRVSSWLYALMGIYSMAYFFIAHRRFYATKRRSSVFIGITLFLLNAFFFLVFFTALMAFSLLMIH